MTESDLSSWSTDYLGRMVKICRQRVREAQAAFQASQQEDRRRRRLQIYESEQAERYARRIEDELEPMVAELRRRTTKARLRAQRVELRRAA